MALSRITKIATGGSNTFAVAFALGYGSEADVTARVGAEVDGLGDPVYRTIDFSVPGFMTINGATVAADVEVVFTRTEDRTELDVDWTDGANITDDNLNKAQLQALRLVHEALDGRLDIASPIDMNGHFINDLPEPVLDSDAATKGYIDAQVEETLPGAVAAAQAAAGTATAMAGTATTQAGIAATQAGVATTQAGIASDAADLAIAAVSAAPPTDLSFGAVKGGADDEVAIDALVAYSIANGVPVALTAGTSRLTGAESSSTDPLTLSGPGMHLSTLAKDTDGGNLLQFSNMQGLYISDLTIDMQNSVFEDAGHGIAQIDTDHTMIERVRIVDQGFGSGLLAYNSVGGALENIVYKDIFVQGDRNTLDTNGTLIVEGLFCRQSGILAKDITSFAVEYKNDTRFSLISDIIAYRSGSGVGYGQTTVGDDGCDFNAATNIVAYACDTGVVIGEGDFNSFSNVIVNSFGAIDATPYGVHLSTDADQNVINSVLSAGANMVHPVRYRGDRNFVSIASHDTATNIVTLDAGVAKNVTEILHPGSRTSIEGAINDSSGNDIDSINGNPVYSPSTGEYLGSISGKFKWKLGTSGASFLSAQKFQFEDDADAVLALAVSSASASTAGFQLNKGATSNFAGLYYAFSSDYWVLRNNNANVLRIYPTTVRPEGDNALDLGAAANRFNEAYVTDLRPGAGTVKWTSGVGTPQGVVTAAVGSLFTRTDGGAATTLYVKETGVGNTGWVAK